MQEAVEPDRDRRATGKLIAYQHELHLYLREGDDENGYESGWNTRYVTDLATPVPFYLRGNEFTAQLYHFIECVQQKHGSTVASFADGAETDIVIDQIAADGGRRS